MPRRLRLSGGRLFPVTGTARYVAYRPGQQTSSIVEDSNTDALREVTCRDDLCFPMTMAAIVGRGRGRGCLGRCGFRAAVLFHSVRMDSVVHNLTLSVSGGLIGRCRVSPYLSSFCTVLMAGWPRQEMARPSRATDDHICMGWMGERLRAC